MSDDRRLLRDRAGLCLDLRAGRQQGTRAPPARLGGDRPQRRQRRLLSPRTPPPGGSRPTRAIAFVDRLDDQADEPRERPPSPVTDGRPDDVVDRRWLLSTLTRQVAVMQHLPISPPRCATSSSIGPRLMVVLILNTGRVEQRSPARLGDPDGDQLSPCLLEHQQATAGKRLADAAAALDALPSAFARHRDVARRDHRPDDASCPSVSGRHGRTARARRRRPGPAARCPRRSAARHPPRCSAPPAKSSDALRRADRARNPFAELQATSIPYGPGELAGRRRTDADGLSEHDGRSSRCGDLCQQDPRGLTTDQPETTRATRPPDHFRDERPGQKSKDSLERLLRRSRCFAGRDRRGHQARLPQGRPQAAPRRQPVAGGRGAVQEDLPGL